MDQFFVHNYPGAPPLTVSSLILLEMGQGLQCHFSFVSCIIKQACHQIKLNCNAQLSSLLKIWNVNKFCGVVGIFNCQGAGWCKVTKKTRIHDASPGTLSGSVQATDVDAIAQIAGKDWNGDTIVYSPRTGEVVRLPKGASLPVTLQVLEYELFHFCPVKVSSI